MSARTDRNRKAAPPVSDESQLWQVIKGHLRAMDISEHAASQLIRDVEKKRQAYIEQQQRQQGKTESDGSVSKDVVRSLYHQLEDLYEEDLQEAGKALEKLEVLMAIRDDPGSDAATKRKKRKTDTSISVASSTSPPMIVTPAKERQISPMTMSKEESNTNSTGSGSSLLPPSTTEREKKRSNSKSNGSSSTPASQQQQQRRGTISASAKDSGAGSGSNAASASLGNNSQKDSTKDSTTTTSSTGASTGYVDPARARREVLAHQLPLQKGRKVAFRQPPKTKSGPGAANVSNMTSRSASSAAASAAQGSAAAGAGAGAGSGQAGNGSGSGATAAPAAQEDEGEQWIMATIIECINNDRNRYVVVDAEDAAMPTYNTTLKAIVPLPESLTTLPSEDYKVGTQVMGLYPDTSCFYQAIVQSGGPGMNGKIMAKMQRRADEILHTPYQLIFEDDGDAIQDVPACFVVERP